MRVAIMQPYFFPYIGYFQLINCVDQFILYDNIEYTKKGWINRNRILVNGASATFSLPLKKSSDYLSIGEKVLAGDFKPDKLLNKLAGAYRNAPNFLPVMSLIERVFKGPTDNLFQFLHHSITAVCDYLSITTEIKVSSHIAIDHNLTCQDKVLALCKSVAADEYINNISGQYLYSKNDFIERGIALSFIQSQPLAYRQFGSPFVPWLSIIDVMMFNSVEKIEQQFLPHYTLSKDK